MPDPEALPPREWNCPHCGRKNPLFAVNCPGCGYRITKEDEARQGIGGRETGLPEPVRRQFEAAKEEAAERIRRHQEYLRNRKFLHVAAGAGIIFLGQMLVMCLVQSVVFPLVFVPLGAFAGWLLNRRGGGNFTGTACFGGAYVLGFGISSALLALDPASSSEIAAVIFFVLGLGGFAMNLVAGYLFGMTLSLSRFDRGF